MSKFYVLEEWFIRVTEIALLIVFQFCIFRYIDSVGF